MFQPESTSELASGERLGVRHLLLWTFYTALIMAGYRVLAQIDNAPAEHAPVSVLHQLAYALAYGAAFTGLTIVIRRWRRGAVAPAPGHCLLVIIGIGALVDGGTIVLVEAIARQEWLPNAYEQYGAMVLHQCIGHIVLALLAAPVIFTAHLPGRWRILMYLILLAFVSHSILCLVLLLQLMGVVSWGVPWNLPYWTIVWATVVCFPAFFAALLLDTIQGVRRNWLHWLGILAALTLAVTEWIGFVRVVILA